MNNLLTGAILKKVMEKHSASLTTSRLLRDSTFQIFETNSRGSEERSIYSPEPNALALELTERVIGEIVKVLERHLARYLTSDLSNPTSELLSLTTNSTADNIAAESFLGLADSLARKAPSARYAHTSKTMFSMNRMQSFLSACGEDLFSNAITQAHLTKLRSKPQDLEIKKNWSSRKWRPRAWQQNSSRTHQISKTAWNPRNAWNSRTRCESRQTFLYQMRSWMMPWPTLESPPH